MPSHRKCKNITKVFPYKLENMIYIVSKRKKLDSIKKQYPNAIICDVTSTSPNSLVKLSPSYPHMNIPIPFSPNYTGVKFRPDVVRPVNPLGCSKRRLYLVPFTYRALLFSSACLSSLKSSTFFTIKASTTMRACCLLRNGCSSDVCCILFRSWLREGGRQA